MTTSLTLGRVTYSVDRTERHFGREYVYFWITTSGIRRDEHVENGGQPVMVTREAWEAIAGEARRLLVEERVREAKG